MRQTDTVTAILTTKPVSLHHTCKAFTLSVGARINILPFLKPVGIDRLAHRNETIFALHSELVDMSLRRESVNGEMAQERLCHVIRMLPTSPDLNSIISMLLLRLVRDHFHPVELEDSARDAHSGFWVVDTGHSFLNGNGTGPNGQGICLAF